MSAPPDLIAKLDQIQATCRDIRERCELAVAESDRASGLLSGQDGPAIGKILQYRRKLLDRIRQVAQVLLHRSQIRVSHDSPSLDDGGSSMGVAP